MNIRLSPGPLSLSSPTRARFKVPPHKSKTSPIKNTSHSPLLSPSPTPASSPASSSMEAISSSALQIQKFPDTSLGLHSAKNTNKQCALLRIAPTSARTLPLRCAPRVSAVVREVSDDGSGEDDSRLDNDNGALRLVTEESLSLSQVRKKLLLSLAFQVLLF